MPHPLVTRSGFFLSLFNKDTGLIQIVLRTILLQYVERYKFEPVKMARTFLVLNELSSWGTSSKLSESQVLMPMLQVTMFHSLLRKKNPGPTPYAVKGSTLAIPP